MLTAKTILFLNRLLLKSEFLPTSRAFWNFLFKQIHSFGLTLSKTHKQMVYCDNNYAVVSGLAEDFLWEVSGCSCDDASLRMGGGPPLNSFTGCFRWGAGWPSSLWCTYEEHRHTEWEANRMSDMPHMCNLYSQTGCNVHGRCAFKFIFGIPCQLQHFQYTCLPV